MARKEIIELIDDLDGGKAEDTVHFALDGVLFEIDLSKDNAERLRSSLARYVKAARRVKRGTGAARMPAGQPGLATKNQHWPPGRPKRVPSELGVKIREWAARQGIPLSPFGRFPDHVLNEYFRQYPDPGSST